MTPAQTVVAVDALQAYWASYDKQPGYENYSRRTLIDDALYGLGIAIDKDQFKEAPGYDKFKALLREHLMAEQSLDTGARASEQEVAAPAGRVTIDATGVYVEGFDYPLDHGKLIDWSCRLASHQAIAWAMERLAVELGKSVAFYRTGVPTDSIAVD
ncbi:MAG: hypothetical protein AB9Q22_10105 [Candidatus Reddybacter sp.]